MHEHQFIATKERPHAGPPQSIELLREFLDDRPPRLGLGLGQFEPLIDIHLDFAGNGMNDEQARIAQQSLYPARRERARMRGIPQAFQPVIRCSQRFVLGSHKVNDGNPSAGPADPHHFYHWPAGIFEVVDRKATDDHIKGIVGIW